MPGGGLHLHKVPRPGPDAIGGQGQDLLGWLSRTAGAGAVAVQAALHLPEEGHLGHTLPDDFLYNRVLNHDDPHLSADIHRHGVLSDDAHLAGAVQIDPRGDPASAQGSRLGQVGHHPELTGVDGLQVLLPAPDGHL